MCNVLGPMVQDTPEQDIVLGEQELPPQMDPEPGMGAVAAAAAECDTSPPLLRNPPPIPAETAQQRAIDIILQAMDAYTQAIINDIRAWGKEKRGETRQMGHGLQADKMATPRAATNELEGSPPAGEDRVIRETCRVTEKVTVTQREKINGVTETCASETRHQVTELVETREVVERLHGADEEEDAHTHTRTCSEGQWGRARRACRDPG